MLLFADSAALTRAVSTELRGDGVSGTGREAERDQGTRFVADATTGAASSVVVVAVLV